MKRDSWVVFQRYLLMACRHSNKQKEHNLERRNKELEKEELNIQYLGRSLKNITFNFKYFTHGSNYGEDFKDWTHEQLVELLNKMVEYSKKTIVEWVNEKNVFKTYTDKAECKFYFDLPDNIPKQKRKWARFRLESKTRLVGFFTNVIDKCDNIFFVVFLDKDHRFYPTEKK